MCVDGVSACVPAPGKDCLLAPVCAVHEAPGLHLAAAGPGQVVDAEAAAERARHQRDVLAADQLRAPAAAHLPARAAQHAVQVLHTPTFRH